MCPDKIRIGSAQTNDLEFRGWARQSKTEALDTTNAS